MELETVKSPCHRCGDRAFPVAELAPGLWLCPDCIHWIGQGSLMSMTAEYLEWETRPDVTQLAPVYGSCYQRLIKRKIETPDEYRKRARRQMRETKRHGFVAFKTPNWKK